VYAVSVTPFDRNGGVDEDTLRVHIRWLLDEGGVHGIIPAGSTGEFAFLSEDEWRQVVRAAVEAVNGQAPVIVGAAACSTDEAIRRAKFAENAGADGVMVIPPYYGHLSQEELYQHFAALESAVGLPIMLYNNPGAAGSDLLPETVARLAALDGIEAIKESTGEMQRVGAIQRLCGENIEVLCGCDTLPLEMFQAGVEGWVAAPSNVIAKECVALYRLAVEAQDFEHARALYARMMPLLELFENSGQYVQLNKAGLELLGRPVGAPRPPLRAPDEAMQKQLREILGNWDERIRPLEDWSIR
jgi:4-hydroxy-tetrahydrodipicolinate synthase